MVNWRVYISKAANWRGYTSKAQVKVHHSVSASTQARLVTGASTQARLRWTFIILSRSITSHFVKVKKQEHNGHAYITKLMCVHTHVLTYAQTHRDNTNACGDTHTHTHTQDHAAGHGWWRMSSVAEPPNANRNM